MVIRKSSLAAQALDHKPGAQHAKHLGRARARHAQGSEDGEQKLRRVDAFTWRFLHGFVVMFLQ